MSANVYIAVFFYSGCSVNMNSQTSSIFSPGYDASPYPKYTSCDWNVSIPDEKNVTLVFGMLEIAPLDYLQVCVNDT